LTRVENLVKFLLHQYFRGHRGRDHVVVGYTSICAISAYHH